MNRAKKILISKTKILLLAITFLLLGSCSLDDKFNADINLTNDVIIANDIEITVKTICIIYEKAEFISAKIASGQVIGVEINDSGDHWTYTFNTDLLHGKIIVDIDTNSNTGFIIKSIDCSNLKICYYQNLWIKLFGTIIVEDINENNEVATCKITTQNFGYNGETKMFPRITISTDYTVKRKVRAQQNDFLSILSQSSSNGKSESLGNYQQTITSNLKINETTYNIIGGKMLIYVDKLSQTVPVEVEYSEIGRTVKYRDNENITYYE